MPAQGIGTVSFSLKDDAGVTHNIDLQNVIFFPQAAQNLISVSQWSNDRKDNCSVTSRATDSTFTWGKDRYSKSIPHPPSVSIPLMRVNEDRTEFALFVTQHQHRFIDRDGILPNSGALTPPPIEAEQTNTESDSISSKQLASNQLCRDASSRSTIQPGDVVRCMIDGKRRFCIIIKQLDTPSKPLTFRVRPTNSSSTITVNQNEIQYIDTDPSAIPTSPTDIDARSLSTIIAPEDITRLWSPKSDSTTSDFERLTLYWHHRLQCAPLKTLYRLAKRGILPRGILKVLKMPICASCAFAAAHRRAWRTKAKKPSPI
jgi:hypothetical protein